MKNFFIVILSLVSILSVKAQSYLGFLQDNYVGVHGIISNPANIVDSRFRTDINLGSASFVFANDYYGIDVFKAINSRDYNLEKEAKQTPSNNNNFYTNLDVLGPSFMFNLAPKHAIALSTRARATANISNVDGELINKLRDKFDASNSFSIPSQSFNATSNSWFEFGLSYALVLLEKNKHFVKAGFTAKFISGLTNNFYNVDNLSTTYTKTGVDKNFNTISTTGIVTFGSNDEGINGNNISYGTGKALDLGFVYEYRPNFEEKTGLKDENKYKYKLGFSVTDIGSINFDPTNVKTYDVTKTISEADYNNQNISGLLDSRYSKIATSNQTTYILPTALHLNFDWNMHKKFYLNFNADQKLTKTNAVNTNTIVNNYSLTPRYESKWFTFSLPISLMEYSGFQAGAGFRLGPLFLGSSSVLTNLVSNNSKTVDIYAGLKIPIYQGKMKDQDQDGVADSEDDCRTEAGPKENKGCPYKDTDRDSILDKDDKCPDVAGATDNQGCPYPDTDKDSVIDKDDKCINEAGPKENNGCPYLDEDKDGVLDKDDKCPTVFGIVALQGCPEEKKVEKIEPVKVEVAAEVIKKINEFSKTILFDTGKATLKAESNTSLDAIVTVLNDYPTANFKIEGHTDNAGIPAKNLKLSKDRADAVKKYFVDKGIGNERLTANGYGSKKPIASNKTLKGKNQNRRVEINLVK